MLKIDVDGVMALNPCQDYDRDRVHALLGDRRWSAVEIIREFRDQIPTRDILWLILRPELIPKMTLHSLACDFAEHALLRERNAGREPDPRSWAVIAAKRLWFRGEATDDELAAACAAARDAAGAAARAAAWAAARDAAWAAAGAAELCSQLDRVLEVLEGA